MNRVNEAGSRWSSGAAWLRGAVAVVVLAAAVLLSLGWLHPAEAATDGVTMDARIDNQPVRRSREYRPIRLSPERPVTLSVDVFNGGNVTVDVNTVRLDGRVVGLTFFSYDTAVAMTLAPGERGSRRFVLDLGGLTGQATGLIPGEVELIDADHHSISRETGVVDVRGSLRSVYGLFGLGVAIITVVSLTAALLGLARHRLPANRWRRALRFVTPGLGLGLLINFTLSATRVFVPSTGRWLTIVFVCAAGMFGFGYLTPAPDEQEEWEEEDEPVPALARAPRRPGVAAPFAPPELPAQKAPEVRARPTVPPLPPSPAPPTLPGPTEES